MGPETVEWVHVGLAAGLVPASVIGQVVVSLGIFSKDFKGFQIHTCSVLVNLG